MTDCDKLQKYNADEQKKRQLFDHFFCHFFVFTMPVREKNVIFVLFIGTLENTFILTKTLRLTKKNVFLDEITKLQCWCAKRRQRFCDIYIQMEVSFDLMKTSQFLPNDVQILIKKGFFFVWPGHLEFFVKIKVFSNVPLKKQKQHFFSRTGIVKTKTWQKKSPKSCRFFAHHHCNFAICRNQSFLKKTPYRAETTNNHTQKRLFFVEILSKFCSASVKTLDRTFGTPLICRSFFIFIHKVIFFNLSCGFYTMDFNSSCGFCRMRYWL